MADQTSLNPPFLRSAGIAILVLVFMFHINVELSFVTLGLFQSQSSFALHVSVLETTYQEHAKKISGSKWCAMPRYLPMSTVKYFASEVSRKRYSKRLNVYCQRQVRDDLRNLRHDLYFRAVCWRQPCPIL